MKHPLIETYRFKQLDSGVYAQHDSELTICDDADDSYIRDSLNECNDLSTDSLELAHYQVNTSSEYHLSASRVNCLRSLLLPATATVLELDCESGSITRYLGELGYHVDAVSHKLVDAENTVLRCRDLPDVNVYYLQRSDIKFPENTYDLILLTHTGKYTTKSRQRILNNAISSLKPGGIIMITEANRLALKAWLGATQVEPALSKKEWEATLAACQLEHYRFLYPFPDHELAEVVLSDRFMTSDRHACSLLYRVNSRDRLNPDWNPEVNEYIRWMSLHEAGYLADFSNSFFILLGTDPKVIKQSVRFDFVKFSHPLKRAQLKKVTFKPIDKKNIQKALVHTLDHDHVEPLSSENYFEGDLLVNSWLTALDQGDMNTFEQLLHQYYSYIKQQLQKMPDNARTVDMLPFNIIIGAGGNHHSFDIEWDPHFEVTVNLVLFRALLWFAFHHEDDIIRCFEKQTGKNAIETIHDFICYGFDILSLDLENSISEYIDLEQQFQSSTDPLHSQRESVRKLVYQPCQRTLEQRKKDMFVAKVYWRGVNHFFNNDNVCEEYASLANGKQKLFFELPDDIEEIDFLRFDPCEQPGFFSLYQIALYYRGENNSTDRLLWQLSGPKDIRRNATIENATLVSSVLGDLYLSLNEDPQFIFKLEPGTIPKTEKGRLMVVAELDSPKKVEYLVMEKYYEAAMDKSRRTIEESIALREKIHSLDKQLLLAHNEIERIVNRSRLRRVIWALAGNGK